MFSRRRQGAIVCSYLSFTDPRLNRTFRLPLVHMRLRIGRNSLRTDALVDSGATATFIPIDIMNMLGSDLKAEGEQQSEQESGRHKKQDAVGAGGTFKTYKAKIDSLQVLKSSTVFCEFNDLNVLVPAKRGSIPHSVLGRDSIFQKYDVTYRERKEQIVFRPPKP